MPEHFLMPEHLRMPHTCKCTAKISRDLELGNRLEGTHDDHVGVQKVCAAHKLRFQTEKIPRGREPPEIRKATGTDRVTLKEQVRKYNTG